MADNKTGIDVTKVDEMHAGLQDLLTRTGNTASVAERPLKAALSHLDTLNVLQNPPQDLGGMPASPSEKQTLFSAAARKSQSFSEALGKPTVGDVLTMGVGSTLTLSGVYGLAKAKKVHTNPTTGEVDKNAVNTARFAHVTSIAFGALMIASGINNMRNTSERSL